MDRSYTAVRMAGYASGLLGAALLFGGRRLPGDAGDTLRGAGAALLILMFAFFVASYVLALVRQLGRGSVSR